MYDTDACLIYSDAYESVAHSIYARLTSSHLTLAAFKWQSEADLTSEYVHGLISRTSAVVIFLDETTLSPWSDIRLRANLEQQSKIHGLRLIFLQFSVNAQKPDFPNARIIEFRDFNEETLETIEAAIGGYRPSKVIYNTGDELPAEVSTELKAWVISGVFVSALEFEPRPELIALRDFWKNSTRNGVMALVGMGGCGKTALLIRLLQETLDNPLTDAALAATSGLPKPSGLFLWSFYDQPNIEYFVRGLYEYLTGTPTADASRDIVYRLIRHLENNSLPHLLIALDGLEIVQENRDSLGGFGLLRDSSLRHLVRRIARGDLPIKLIVTSRYPLPELQSFDGTGYWQIDTNRLDDDTARQFLRKRGVDGTDRELDRLLREFGTHALTLDHLGRVLYHYFDGNPQATASLPLASADMNDDQARPLVRVLSFIEANLPVQELSILRVISVLRKPVSMTVLAEYFSKPRASNTFYLSSDILRELVGRLQQRGLVTFYGTATERICTLHPAIRDHFYSSFVEKSQVHTERQAHLVSLTDQASIRSRAVVTNALDIYEDMIFHAAHSSDPREAVSLYERLGGYQHLAWRLGDYQRGLRITSTLMAGLGANFANVRTCPAHENSLFLLDLGYPLAAEQQTRALMVYLQELAKTDHTDADWSERWENPLAWAKTEHVNRFGMYESGLWQTLTDCLLAQGHLAEAREMMDNALVEDRDWRVHGGPEARNGSNPYGRRALAHFWMGNISEALDDFKAADEFAKNHTRFSLIVHPHWHHKTLHATVLVRLGHLKAAHRRLGSLDYEMISAFRPLTTAYYHLAAAEIACLSDQDEQAVSPVEKVLAWAMQTGNQHVYTQALIMRARLMLRQNQMEHATALLDKARDLARSRHFNLQVVDTLILAGHLAIQQSEVSESEVFAHEALSISTNLLYRWGNGDAVYLLAKCAYEQQQYPTALEYAQNSLDVRKLIRDPKVAHSLTLIQNIEPLL